VFTQSRGIVQGRFKATSSAAGRSQRSNAVGNPVESHKKRIFDAVNQLNEDELEKISQLLKAQEAEATAREGEDEAREEEEGEAKIESMSPDEITYQEHLTSVSRAGGVSEHSRALITKLQSQLDEERAARQQLQNELSEL